MSASGNTGRCDHDKLERDCARLGSINSSQNSGSEDSAEQGETLRDKEVLLCRNQIHFDSEGLRQ